MNEDERSGSSNVLRRRVKTPWQGNSSSTSSWSFSPTCLRFVLGSLQTLGSHQRRRSALIYSRRQQVAGQAVPSVSPQKSEVPFGEGKRKKGVNTCFWQWDAPTHSLLPVGAGSHAHTDFITSNEQMKTGKSGFLCQTLREPPDTRAKLQLSSKEQSFHLFLYFLLCFGVSHTWGVGGGGGGLSGQEQNQMKPDSHVCAASNHFKHVWV